MAFAALSVPPAQRIVEVAVHIDSVRDKGNAPARLSLFSGASAGFLSETPDDEIVLPSKFAGWALLRPASGGITSKCLQVRPRAASAVVVLGLPL